MVRIHVRPHCQPGHGQFQDENGPDFNAMAQRSKVPSTNIQAPEKLQASNLNPRFRSLGFEDEAEAEADGEPGGSKNS